jgi:hypothetical protein
MNKTFKLGLSQDAVDRLYALCNDQQARIAELERQIKGYQSECRDVEQALGRALGYPRFCDDQKNFPGSTDADGVCVGEHTPATVAESAARRIAELESVIREAEETLSNDRYDARVINTIAILRNALPGNR